MNKYKFSELVLGDEGLLKGPFGSDLKKSLYVEKSESTFKVYIQENILERNNDVGHYYISEDYYRTKMSRYAVKENDFIVTCDGTLGEIFQLKNIKEKGIISSSLLRITLNPDLVDYDYFYFLFKTLLKWKLIRQGNNSVLKHLPGLNEIKNLEIELPDIKEQRAIGSFLKKIENKIDLNVAMIDKLSNISEIVYTRWFIQYQSSLEDEHQLVWVDAIKRKMPINWEVKTIKDICSITWGQCPNGSDIFGLEEEVSNSIPYCSGAGDMHNGILVDCQAKTNKSRRFANKNDILMSVAGSIGAYCVCNRKISLGRAAVAFTPISVPPIFVLETIKIFLKRMKVIAGGSIQKVINDDHLDEIKFPFSYSVCEKFGEKYSKLLELQIQLEEEKRSYVDLLDYLAPLLIGGKVKIGEN